MPSLRTRARYDRITLDIAQVALSAAATAVEVATDTLNTVQGTIEEIQGGTLDLDAITVGGTRFVYDVGTGGLVMEP